MGKSSTAVNGTKRTRKSAYDCSDEKCASCRHSPVISFSQMQPWQYKVAYKRFGPLYRDIWAIDLGWLYFSLFSRQTHQPHCKSLPNVNARWLLCIICNHTYSAYTSTHLMRSYNVIICIIFEYTYIKGSKEKMGLATVTRSYRFQMLSCLCVAASLVVSTRTFKGGHAIRACLCV